MPAPSAAPAPLEPADLDRLLEVVADVARSGEFILRSRCAELEQVLTADLGGAHARVVSSPEAALALVLTAVGAGTGNQVRVAASPPGLAAIADQVGRLPIRCKPFVRGDLMITDLRGADHGTAGPSGRHALNVAVTDQLPGRRHTLDLTSWTALIVDLGPRSQARGVGAAAAVLTADGELAERVRFLRNHGQDGITRFLHHYVGFNARMDEIAAGYLVGKLSERDR